MLASRIQEVFEDDKLAVELSSQAHSIALDRHDPGIIIQEIMAVYEDVLKRVS